MLGMCLVNKMYILDVPEERQRIHFITDDAAAWVTVFHPSIHPCSIAASSRTKQTPFTARYHGNRRCDGFISVVDNWEDPPVKAIISVRRQVLLQFIVGLLYFPTEILQLAIQRVLRAGRVVSAVHDPREPSVG